MSSDPSAAASARRLDSIGTFPSMPRSWRKTGQSAGSPSPFQQHAASCGGTSRDIGDRGGSSARLVILLRTLSSATCGRLDRETIADGSAGGQRASLGLATLVQLRPAPRRAISLRSCAAFATRLIPRRPKGSRPAAGLRTEYKSEGEVT